MKFNPRLLALAAAAFLAPAHALLVNGTTVGGPTFNRPLTLTTTSGTGTAVPYAVLPFTVAVAGVYTFLTITSGAYDPHSELYTAFMPSAPLSNLLAFNDDAFGSLNASGFTFTLATGTTYRYVVTGFDNNDFGAFTVSITGPGDAVLAPIPEPTSYLMMALGLAGVGAVARRSGRRTA